MLEILKIRLAARCEAAGRAENEDNYQIAEDLSTNNIGFTTDKVFSLSSKGTLLLVCDGMGGMNAGEVASAIGVETIKNLFSPQLLTNDVLASDESICNYMKSSIVKADSRIKEEANKDDAKHGMGSTAVMAWLLGHKVYVAWCGDSRCYRYNPATGLEQLSHDHSYVQDLVDTGQLMPTLAFDHPNKNIITRSLGDPRGAARPEAKIYNLYAGDVILLCSDGLSDSLRDEEIEQSISRSLSSMAVCRDSLWNDSKQAGWHDNVTILLAQIMDENTTQAKQKYTPKPQSSVVAAKQMEPKESVQSRLKSAVSSTNQSLSRKPNWKVIFIVAVVLLILTFVTIKNWNYGQKPDDKKNDYTEYCNEMKVLEDVEYFNEKKRSNYDTIKHFVDIWRNMYEIAPDSAPTTGAKKNLEDAIENALELFKEPGSGFEDLVKPIEELKKELP